LSAQSQAALQPHNVHRKLQYDLLQRGRVCGGDDEIGGKAHRVEFNPMLDRGPQLPVEVGLMILWPDGMGS